MEDIGEYLTIKGVPWNVANIREVHKVIKASRKYCNTNSIQNNLFCNVVLQIRGRTPK